MTQTLAEPIARLIEEFGKLPGVGPKTAQRLTFHLLRQPADEAHALAAAIDDVKEKIIFCGTCSNPSAADPCPTCADAVRDRPRTCVVEELLDILPVDRSGVYRGLVHGLEGGPSPMEGVLVEERKLRELGVRGGGEPVQEVIVATHAPVGGEAAANLVRQRLRSAGLKIARLAQGLRSGSDL